MHNLSTIAKNYRLMKYYCLSAVLIMGLFIMILLTTSCSKKPIQSKIDTVKASLSIARLVDIPIPLGFVPLHQESSTQTSMLQFQGSKLFENSLQFYLQEMDRFGWKLTNFSTQTHGVLFCEKGYRLCIINITQQEKTTVTLHIKTSHNKRQKKIDINKKQLDLKIEN